MVAVTQWKSFPLARSPLGPCRAGLFFDKRLGGVSSLRVYIGGTVEGEVAAHPL